MITLVLDLDETLVHSYFQPNPCDIQLQISVDGMQTNTDVYVRKRPGADEIIQRLADKYELVIFTASLRSYGNPLIDLYDPKGYVTHRLYREHCSVIARNYVKDLRKLGRDLNKVIIVDNSPISYYLQPENAIPISSWMGNPEDLELYKLTQILETLCHSQNIKRDILKVYDTISPGSSPETSPIKPRASWNSPKKVGSKEIVILSEENQEFSKIDLNAEEDTLVNRQ